MHCFPADRLLQGFPADCISRRNDNMLLVAPAGYGKSETIKYVIVPALNKKHGNKGVWNCATTGLAAQAVGGATIHSQAGVKRGKGLPHLVIESLGKQPDRWGRWLAVNAIVIEECSMMSDGFLTLLDQVAKAAKQNDRPFGGVQIILVGDLAQLAPVPDYHRNPDTTSNIKHIKKPVGYLFESDAFKKGCFHCLRLKHCWRYDEKGELGQFLSSLRLAHKLSPDLKQGLQDLVTKTQVPLKDAVVLCTTRERARAWSVSMLKSIPHPDKVFFGVDTRSAIKKVNTVADENADEVVADMQTAQSAADPGHAWYLDEDNKVRSLFSSIAAPPVVRLRVGAKVLCTMAIDKKVPVGSTGLVVSFRNPDEAVSDALLTRFETGYGVTKAQINEDWPSVCSDNAWPYVEFTTATGQEFRLCMPTLFTIEDNLDEVICSRTQLPIILGYALTVHRAQGMTLDSVVFHMGGMFAFGQLYTALSRVRNFMNLRVTGNISGTLKLANKVVTAFEQACVWHTIDNSPGQLDFAKVGLEPEDDSEP